MEKENVNAERLLTSAQGMLSGAIDLLHNYAEQSEDDTDSVRMYGVVAILKEVHRKLNFCEAEMNGGVVGLTINNLI